MSKALRNGVRSCGESDDDRCSACCYSHAVEHIRKKELFACGFQDSAGCGIYPSRPKACRRFLCAWAERTIGADHERPDKVGLVFSRPITQMEDAPPILFAGEAWFGSLQEPAAQQFLAKVLQNGYAVQMRSRNTDPRSQWHILRRPDMEAFVERLKSRDEYVVWHECYVPTLS